jgi:hypothetical protein
MGPIGSPETSVRNYHYSLRNNAEERSSPFQIIVISQPAIDAEQSCEINLRKRKEWRQNTRAVFCKDVLR